MKNLVFLLNRLLVEAGFFPVRQPDGFITTREAWDDAVLVHAAHAAEYFFGRRVTVQETRYLRLSIGFVYGESPEAEVYAEVERMATGRSRSFAAFTQSLF